MARTISKAPKANPIKAAVRPITGSAVRPTTGSAVRPVASTVKPAVKPKVSAVKQPGYTTPVVKPVKPTTKKY